MLPNSDYPIKTIVIRADASIQSGTGHVMRCLTLAEQFRSVCSQIVFFCRRHRGNLIASIKEKGFDVCELPLHPDQSFYGKRFEYLEWLGCSQQTDAQDCINQIHTISDSIDLLVVDNYALDENWEKQIRPYVNKIMVIDDLADRKHDCDLLLDQTFDRNVKDYFDFVEDKTRLLVGAKYALLRQEFSEWRPYSLQRRNNPSIKQILITLGGVDSQNVTSEILNSLYESALPKNTKIIVIMGNASPWLENVMATAKQASLKVEVRINVNNMAELMANSDFAISAAGATAWELCCLGLPTLMVVLAENQRQIAANLHGYGSVILLERENLKKMKNLIDGLNKVKLKKLSNSGSKIIDGLGAHKTLKQIIPILQK